MKSRPAQKFFHTIEKEDKPMSEKSLDIDPALVKLMEDEVNAIYPIDHHPDVKVCDVNLNYKGFARRLAENLQRVLNS